MTPNPHTVCVNAWTTEDGAQTYTDEPERIEGWSVYVRKEIDQHPAEPFDIIADVDVTTREEADDMAKHLASTYHHDGQPAPIQWY